MKYNEVPDEILYNILKVLPSKSLVRFKSISKSWSSLISDDPNFLKMAGLIVYSNASISIMNYDLSRKRVSKLNLPTETHRCLQVLGSCNGLLSLSADTIKFLIWGPMTGGHKLLPFKNCPIWNFSAVGFGYEESNKDFLMVCFTIVGKSPWIYSVGNNSWQCLKKIPGRPRIKFDPVSIATVVKNKILYWSVFYQSKGLDAEDGSCVIRNNENSDECEGTPFLNQIILRVNSVDKSHVLLFEPPKAVNVFEQSQLMNFKEGLCVMRYQRDRNIDLWVLKDQDAKFNWQKLMFIQIPESIPHHRILTAICFVRDDDVLLNVRERTGHHHLVTMGPCKSCKGNLCSLLIIQ